MKADVGTWADDCEQQPLCGYRPVVDLATGRIDRYECISVDAADLVGRGKDCVWPNRQTRWAFPFGQAIDDLCTHELADLIISVPADILVNDFPAATDLTQLRTALQGGKRLTVLAGWPDAGAGIAGVAEALDSWRRIGCDIGIDNFGYAAIPMLWPQALPLSVVRLDARLMEMAAAGTIGFELVGKVIEFVRAAGVRQVIVDGCSQEALAGKAEDHGATHGQGRIFGRLRYGFPALL